MPYEDHKRETGSERYARYAQARFMYLQRGYSIAELIHPGLLARPGLTSARTFPTPFQGVGQSALTHFSSLVLLTALPPNSAFFRLAVDPLTAKRLKGDPTTEQVVNEQLSMFERKMLQEIDLLGIRPVAAEAFLHWATVGNALFVFYPKSGKCRVFPLANYVCERDTMGNILCIITVERISRRALSPTMKEIVDAAGLEPTPTTAATDLMSSSTANDEYDLYTIVERTKGADIVTGEGGGMFEAWQEIGDVQVAPANGKKWTYPEDALPWIPMRYSVISGESYGRGFGEQIYGTMVSLEGLSQILVEGCAAISKVTFMVDETLGANIRELSRASNGAYIPGRANAVNVVQSNKAMEFKVVEEAIQRLTEEVYRDALYFIPRQGDRVTAEENQIRARQLEMGRGGVFSLVNQEWVRPFLSVLMERMKARDEWPKMVDPRDGREKRFKKSQIRPLLITGLEALGRSQEFDQATQYFGALQQLFGPQTVNALFDLREIASRLANSKGVDPIAYGIKSREVILAEQDQLRQQQMAAQLAGPAASVAGAAIRSAPQPEAASAA